MAEQVFEDQMVSEPESSNCTASHLPVSLHAGQQSAASDVAVDSLNARQQSAASDVAVDSLHARQQSAASDVPYSLGHGRRPSTFSISTSNAPPNSVLHGVGLGTNRSPVRPNAMPSHLVDMEQEPHSRVSSVE